jgi:hypothetical protein
MAKVTNTVSSVPETDQAPRNHGGGCGFIALGGSYWPPAALRAQKGDPRPLIGAGHCIAARPSAFLSYLILT